MRGLFQLAAVAVALYLGKRLVDEVERIADAKADDVAFNMAETTLARIETRGMASDDDDGAPAMPSTAVH